MINQLKRESMWRFLFDLACIITGTLGGLVYGQHGLWHLCVAFVFLMVLLWGITGILFNVHLMIESREPKPFPVKILIIHSCIVLGMYVVIGISLFAQGTRW